MSFEMLAAALRVPAYGGIESVPPAQPVPPSGLVQRFEAAMAMSGSAGGVQASAATHAAAVDPRLGRLPSTQAASAPGDDDGAPAAVARTEGKNAFGDRILQHLQGVSDEYSSVIASPPAEELNPAISPFELLRFQSKVLGMSVQVELVSKCISRSTQNIDQLVRMQ